MKKTYLAVWTIGFLLVGKIEIASGFCPRADIDRDCDVDGKDLAIVAEEFDPVLLVDKIEVASDSCPRADIDGDCDVDEEDLAIVAEEFGTVTDTYTNSLGIRFNLIPAGTFTMGSPDGNSEYPKGSGETPAAEPGRWIDEKPHQVTLTQSYFMQTTEVTQGQWRAMMDNNPSGFSSCGDDCPVETVNWFEAAAFANAVSQSEGLQECYQLNNCTNMPGNGMECETVILNSPNCSGYRLPTEAEFEYAARAGTTTAFASGELTGDPWSCDNPVVDDMAWYCNNAGETVHPVAQKLDNAWGLYDMHGNVWEWVQDWYDSYPTTAVTDPTGPTTGLQRVIRGGAWDNRPRYTRSAHRNRDRPIFLDYYLGFRLVLPPVH